jgi:hypothetical protein
MAKVKSVSQFAHDIAVKVLERFDRFDACKVALAKNDSGKPVDPWSLDAACMCITGRIVNACPDGNRTYRNPAVLEITRTVYPNRSSSTGSLYARNDHIFNEHGPAALKERTRKLFEKIAALPVVDDAPRDFRVGGVYQDKQFCDGPDDVVTVARIEPQHNRFCNEPVAVFTNGEFDRVSYINRYRRVR